jgi:mannitol/fructose-specific phosphotransferase system IIA component (Ntr-type)
MRNILTALQEGRLFELPDSNKTRALEFLARILDANPNTEVGTDAIDEIQRREQECNTGMGLGVGVPHIRAKREEGELFCAIGWSQAGIDYGAADGEHVHLVFMFYIPGAQKNVYLKEISSLFKAIKKSGGIEPIAHADNLLLDWVSAVLSESGPESVARMIKLEVKQAQVAAGSPSTPATPEPAVAARPAVQLMRFSVLVVPSATIVLSADAGWIAAFEKETNVGQQLASGRPFLVAGRQVFVTDAKLFPNGRVFYECVSLTN